MTMFSRRVCSRAGWFALGLLLGGFSGLRAQPSHVGPMPSTLPVSSAEERRVAYEARIQEVLEWYTGLVKPSDPLIGDLVGVSARLALGRDLERCSRSVIELMKTPGSSPFWMFPTAGVAYLGRDKLSPEARAAIRRAWSSVMQLRGDTENHWAMYYASLYLMAQLYPNEPASSWYTGKSSEENLAEARDYLIHWMRLATTVGQESSPARTTSASMRFRSPTSRRGRRIRPCGCGRG